MDCSKRVEKLLRHLNPDISKASQECSNLTAKQCIGEMENREAERDNEMTALDGSRLYRIQRIPIKIVFADSSAADERYGGAGSVAIVEGELMKPDTKQDTVIVFMHPSGIQNLLPMPVALAKGGLHVATCTSRYPNNDTCLIMEKVLVDLNAYVDHLKTKLKYKKVVLAGWSGGGSLVSFYQSQAEHPTVTHTPAGDTVDLSMLTPADAVMIMAAHTSRAKIFTEWLDPSVLSESDPSFRDPSLDIYNPSNRAPYSQEYLQRYRLAQQARNRKITMWVKDQLRRLNSQSDKTNESAWKQQRRDIGFVTMCTQADPRRLDLSIDANDREVAEVSELAAENHSPVGLARFSTLRSWLSQWSIDDTQADGPSNISKISVPVLVLENSADNLVPPCHTKAYFDAVSHQNKEYIRVDGATHYYFGQWDLLLQAVGNVKEWLIRQGL